MTGCMVPGLRSGVDAGSLVLLSTGTVEGIKDREWARLGNKHRDVVGV